MESALLKYQSVEGMADSAVQISAVGAALAAYQGAVTAYDSAKAILDVDGVQCATDAAQVIANIGSSGQDGARYVEEAEEFQDGIEELLVPEDTLETWTEAQVYPSDEDVCTGYTDSEVTEEGKFRIWAGHECHHRKTFYLYLPVSTWN